jgi:toxin ParE1/3/4
MELRWSEEAANDLERITDYLCENTPERAPDLIRAIYDAPTALLTFPRRGRPGKRKGTRELVLSSLPSAHPDSTEIRGPQAF